MGFIPTLVPPYQQPGPVRTNFVPKANVIINVTVGFPCEITTLTDHNYDSTLYVTLYFPNIIKMQRLNGKTYPITVTAANKFTIPVDTTNFDPVMLSAYQNAQCVPAAEQNFSLTMAVNNNARR